MGSFGPVLFAVPVPVSQRGPALVVEDVLDRPFEQMGNSEREGQAGVVLPPLEGVDGLAGHAELTGEFRLGPLVICP